MSDTTHLYFIAVAKANFEYSSVMKGNRFLNAHIGLEISPNLSPDFFYDGGGKVFNKEGSVWYTEAAIAGLVANIHLAHQKGWRDSAEHLRHIMEMLQEGFAQVMNDVKTDVINVQGNVNLKNTAG